MQFGTGMAVMLAALAALGLTAWVVMQGGGVRGALPEAVEAVSLELAYGAPLTGYAAGPEDAKAGVLIVHDWFGVTQMTLEVVARLGALGYRALAVDLYDGQAAATHPEAAALMSALDEQAVRAKLRAGIDALAVPQRRLAIWGFSMGGIYAMQASLDNTVAVDATLVFYGDVVTDAGALAALKGDGPVLFVTGSADNPEMGFALSRAAGEAGKMAEIYIYPGAQHAFAQPLFAGGKTYDSTATRLAFGLAEDFLARHLRPAN